MTSTVNASRPEPFDVEPEALAIILPTPPVNTPRDDTWMDDHSFPNKGKRPQQTQLLLLPSVEEDKGADYLRKNKNKLKTPVTKKQKRVNPYEKRSSTIHLLDEENLLDTPIQSMEGVLERALVASPNKPPGHT